MKRHPYLSALSPETRSISSHPNPSSVVLHCGEKQLDLTQPQVMGILNVTPDSFSDGGNYHLLDAALFRAEQMMREGAAIIDVGGESTKPRSISVSVQEELDRVIPVIEALRDCPIPISIDTRKTEVMQAAISAGASFINAENALEDEAALLWAAPLQVPICLMHCKGEPKTMQDNPFYTDVVSEVSEFLMQRAQACLSAGIASHRLILDPGIGFGKTLTHNLQLLKAMQDLRDLGYPLLAGVSRKAMLGELLNKPPTDRLAGSLALATWLVMQDVKILRVHDVAATCDVVKVMMALKSASSSTLDEHYAPPAESGEYRTEVFN
jgi:dihydropteroate synthase